jgi:hypothetical protein
MLPTVFIRGSYAHITVVLYFLFFLINLLEIPALHSNKEYRMANSVKGKFNKFKNMHILDQQCKYCEEEEKIQQKIESNESFEIVKRIDHQSVRFLFISKMK